MLIGLAGFAGSGKDTVGKILVDHYNFKRVAFADKVKELALKLDPFVHLPMTFSNERLSSLVERAGWDETKREPEVRELLQRIGAGVRDVLGEDTWIDAALWDYNRYGVDTVITDVRYPNELDVIRENGGVVWWIERPGVGPVNDHESENSVSGASADLTLFNWGSRSYLCKTAKEAMKQTIKAT